MDLVHGVGNFAIALVLFKPLRRWMMVLKTKYEKR